MKSYIEERALEVGNYIVEHNATVRQAAKNYGISKSTVHKDVSERLPEINQSLAAQVRKVLDVNAAGWLQKKSIFISMRLKIKRQIYTGS